MLHSPGQYRLNVTVTVALLVVRDDKIMTEKELSGVGDDPLGSTVI